MSTKIRLTETGKAWQLTDSLPKTEDGPAAFKMPAVLGWMQKHGIDDDHDLEELVATSPGKDDQGDNREAVERLINLGYVQKVAI